MAHSVQLHMQVKQCAASHRPPLNRLTVLGLPPMQGAVLLARAMKDYERKGGLKDGFSSVPADCVAYKFYRDVSPELLFSVIHIYHPAWLLCLARVQPVLRCEAAMATSSSAKGDLAPHHKGACDSNVSYRAAMVQRAAC